MQPKTIVLCLVWLREPTCWAALVLSRGSHTRLPTTKRLSLESQPFLSLYLHSLLSVCFPIWYKMWREAGSRNRLFVYLLCKMRSREAGDPKERHIITGSSFREFMPYFSSHGFFSFMFSYTIMCLFMRRCMVHVYGAEDDLQDWLLFFYHGLWGWISSVLAMRHFIW